MPFVPASAQVKGHQAVDPLSILLGSAPVHSTEVCKRGLPMEPAEVTAALRWCTFPTPCAPFPGWYQRNIHESWVGTQHEVHASLEWGRLCMRACLLFRIFGNSPGETTVFWMEEPRVPPSELGLPRKLATLRHTCPLSEPSSQESCFFSQQPDKHNSASWALSFSLLWADRQQVAPHTCVVPTLCTLAYELLDIQSKAGSGCQSLSQVSGA